jgi:MFS family permease
MKQSNGADDEKLILPLPKWKLWYMMVVLYVLYLLDFATRSVISPMFPLLKAELGLSDTQLGLLGTTVLAAIGLLAIPLSYIHDRWTRGKMISLMALVWSIGSFMSGLATNFAQLVASRAVLGVGEASFASGGQSLVMATFKKSRRATVTGTWMTATAVGTALGMLVGGAVAVKFGWRTAFMAVALPGILFAVLAWFMADYKNPPRNATADGKSINFGSVMKDIFKNKTVVALCVAYGISNLFAMSIMYWLPTYFNRYMGMDVALSGTLTAAIMLTSLIASPVGGLIGDRISRKIPRYKALFICISVVFSLTGFICAVAFKIWFLFAIVTFCTYAFMPVQQTAIQEVVPYFQRATAYGLYVFSALFLGGLWGPLMTGAISDAATLDTAMWVNGAILLIALIAFIVVYKTFDADYYRSRRLEQEVGVVSA